MRKSGIFLYITVLGFLIWNGSYYKPLEMDDAAAESRETVYIGGMPTGFTLSMGGVQIVGLSEIMSKNGVVAPAKEAGIRPGDLIYKIAGIKVSDIQDVSEILSKVQDKEEVFSVKRGEQDLEIKITPAKDRINGKYKIGILIRDSLSGIGTVTYIKKSDRKYGALGHAIYEDNSASVKFDSGLVFPASIIGVQKGQKGRAGELKGVFLDETFGTVDQILDSGIYGTVSDAYDLSNLPTFSVAKSSEVKIGTAYIYSCVDGANAEKYEIEIAKIDKGNKSNKNYVVKICDKRLLSETGGIVQGMSGSPIIQNDKIIGAVTHVFLNDPTRGYGISIEKMIKNSQK